MPTKYRALIMSIVLILSTGCATKFDMSLKVKAASDPEHSLMLTNREKISLLIHNDAGWQARLDAAEKLERAYHYVSDHSTDELKLLRNEVTTLVEKARKAVSKSESYHLTNVSLAGQCKNGGVNFTNTVENRVPLMNGLAVISGIDEYNPWFHSPTSSSCLRQKGHIYRIESSRGRVIFGVVRGVYYDEFSTIANRKDLGTTALIALVKN